MTVCIRCKRPLKYPSQSGMGPVCARKSPPAAQPVEPDLLGYDIEGATSYAYMRVLICATAAAAQAMVDTRRAFRAARVRLGVWA